MTHPRKVPLDYERKAPEEVSCAARSFRECMATRRSIRAFSADPVPEAIIRDAIATAHSAPSGANMQPWYFVAVSDGRLKHRLRLAAEAEERELYAHRASDEWLDALAPLGTDADKGFLETAPWLIAVFARKYTTAEDGTRRKHYYTPESVGIATGFLIAALHQAGLGTLTHTPSPMGFLNELLERPKQDRAFMLLVVGYPADNAEVPDIEKLPLDDVLTVL